FEGSFLLDPSALWAAHSYEVKMFYDSRKSHNTMKGIVEYSQTINGVPYLKHAKRESLLKNGSPATEEELFVKSIEFGSVNPDEFRLRHFNAPEIVPAGSGGLPKAFYISSAGAILTIVVIIFLRRRMSGGVNAPKTAD